MFQRLQDTDAYILMEFRQCVKHLKGHPVDASFLLQMKKLGTPFHQRLLQNGHSATDAADLMRSAWKLIEV